MIAPKNLIHNKTGYYIEKINDLKKEYPEITKQNRRTGKALKSICFFIWYYAKEENDQIVDLLFKASVLLSAQDDFFDNPRISQAKKKEFRYALENVIEDTNHSVQIQHPQPQELIALWKEVVHEMKKVSPQLYSHWENKVHKLNKAMENEIYLMKKREIDFDEYMETAIDSIGVIFILTTYLVKKSTSPGVLQALEPYLLLGAHIARLSNDIASWRENKNRVNAVSIIREKKDPKKYIAGLITREQQKLNRGLQQLKIQSTIRQTIQKFTKFLVEFYKTSDFDT